VGFVLLGPVAVWTGAEQVDLGAPRQRLLLSALAAEAGRVVPTDVLLERLWGEEPPEQARRTLHTYLARLRRAVERVPGGGGRAAAVRARSGGYLLDVDDGEVDLLRFRGLVARAQGARGAAALPALREAVGLWQGPPLGGVPGEWAERARRSWQQEQVAAVLAWADAELVAGTPADVLVPLADLAVRHPLVEPVAAARVRLLAAVGRRPEALECYAVMRDRLAAELGMDPGPELRSAYEAVLRGDPPADPTAPTGPPGGFDPGRIDRGGFDPRRIDPDGIDPGRIDPRRIDRDGFDPGGSDPRRIDPDGIDPGRTVPGRIDPGRIDPGRIDPGRTVPGRIDPDRTDPAWVGPGRVDPGRIVPAQLPADVRGFTGRAAELAAVDALGSGVVAVAGTAGVGKTAFAVHWAHRATARFPDGQLYVNLRGFDPAGESLDPARAVRGFLDALGVPPERVPADLDGQVALYRGLLDGRRMLVLLDNARDAEQVRPLLPGSRTCLTLVTSRDRLAPLVADGARSLPLDLLSTAEAGELLAARLGAGDPGAVERVVAACAHLPLALCIVAARAEITGFPLGVLAAELTGAGDRLGVLDAGDQATQVRTVFSWSYAALTGPAARLFRLLGLHPGPDVTVPVAASLAGVADAAGLVAELSRASLLTEHSPGRYARHDLLTAYAAELTAAVDPAAERQAATTRLAAHYAHTARAGRLLHDPGSRVPEWLPLGDPPPGVTPEPLADSAAGFAWVAAELPALRGIWALTGVDAQVWWLAWGLSVVLDRLARWPDWAAAWEAAVAAAERRGDLGGTGYACRELAEAYVWLGDYPAAYALLERAMELGAAVGDKVGAGNAHLSYGVAVGKQGDDERAVAELEEALRYYQAAGFEGGIASALNCASWGYALIGQAEKALDYAQQALELHRRTRFPWGEASAHDAIGWAYHQMGDYEQAVRWFREAVRLYGAVGDRYQQADTHVHLGDSLVALGDRAAARAAYADGLAILDAMGHTDAAGVRAKLDGLGPGGS
jgi:DNA-binding SARP family transcriptional activator/tetratricopeptide (TPR) repeat protein